MLAPDEVKIGDLKYIRMELCPRCGSTKIRKEVEFYQDSGEGTDPIVLKEKALIVSAVVDCLQCGAHGEVAKPVAFEPKEVWDRLKLDKKD